MLNSNVLKVAHHGSNSSSSNKILQLIKPSLSIISAGFSNRYNHPHQHVLNRLNHYSSVLNTAKHGHIELMVTNYRIIINTARHKLNEVILE